MNKVLKTFLTLVTLITILTSSTCKHERKQLDSWIGKTKKSVVRSWGIPDKTSTDYNGGEILVYSRSYYLNGTTFYNHYLLFFNNSGLMDHWLKQQSVTPPQAIDLRINN